jgi:hypothetical protein
MVVLAPGERIAAGKRGEPEGVEREKSALEAGAAIRG